MKDFWKDRCFYWYKRFNVADKRAKMWRKEAKRLRVDRNRWIDRAYRWQEDADLRRNNAWIAFYIATVLYIVGIVIMIWG